MPLSHGGEARSVRASPTLSARGTDSAKAEMARAEEIMALAKNMVTMKEQVR